MTVEYLREGPQPTTLEEWVGMTVGAAGTCAPYGPGTGIYDEAAARAITEWAIEGIRNL